MPAVALRAIALFALAGCVTDHTVDCGDHRCPAGTVCTPTRCTTPAAIAECDGIGEGEACDTGACHEGACWPVVCGDGVTDPGEACDDENTVAGDGCSETCASTERCGNGVVDPIAREQCDEGVAGLSRDGCTSTCLTELASWRQATTGSIPGRAGAYVAYDSDRDRIVVFAGYAPDDFLDDTWEWNGDWIHIHPPTQPPPRYGGAIAYDAARHQTVLFGGWSALGPLADTWVYDGTTWTELHPTTLPMPRFNTTMTYDSARQRVVLFAGTTAAPYSMDNSVWEWDGTNWSEHAVTPAPIKRYAHQLTSDPLRQVTVVHGGVGTGVALGDTWEWNGTSWTDVTAPGPGGRYHGAMAYDGVLGEVVLYGGIEASQQVTSSTWSWNGSRWLERSGTFSPPARTAMGLVWNGVANSVVLFGGNKFPEVLSDVWTFTVSDWLEIAPAIGSPTERGWNALAFDPRRGRAILFGGWNQGAVGFLNDTWEWDGDRWRALQPQTVPPVRSDHMLVYDLARDRIVMFGGVDSSTRLDDTWEWDGDNWLLRTPATSPSGRATYGMAYDEAHARTVMFGGREVGGSEVNETWLWDGTTWANATPSSSPPARIATAMTYDRRRQRVVMFGGRTGVIALADTWEWDGTAWSNLTPVTGPSPSPRVGALLVYDPNRQRPVLFGGGNTIDGEHADTWEWDGQRWEQRLIAQVPPLREFLAGDYDALRGNLVVFGGDGFAQPRNDTWLLELSNPAQAPDACRYATLDTDGDGLAGCNDPDCWPRCTPLCPPGIPCSGGPSCGDGTCSVIEDYLLCPSDCAAP